MLWSRPPESKKTPESGKPDRRRMKQLASRGDSLYSSVAERQHRRSSTPTVNPVIEKAFVEHKVMKMHNITNEQRIAAAEVAKAKGLKVVGAVNGPATKAGGAAALIAPPPLVVPQPGGIPDYFGANSNYALSQLPGCCQWYGNAGNGYQEVR